MTHTIDKLIAELPPERRSYVEAKSQQLVAEMMTLKDHVKGQVRFQFYRKGALYYKTDSGFEFTVPISDTGDGVFLAEDKDMMFMRYIRKQMEENDLGRKSSL